MINMEQSDTKLVSFDDSYVRFTRTAFYIRAEVVAIINEKSHRLSSGVALWLRENRRLRKRNQSVRLLTRVDLERFEQQDRYPTWAVQQLLDIAPTAEAKSKRPGVH